MAWHPMDEFKTPGIFEAFMDWLKEENPKEVPVKIPYSQGLFPERWFQNPTDGTIWRLLEPDFPFLGFFMQVDMDNPKENKIG